jgi:processive 1,2-diacylglycerol beta-glucosyltransferase
MHIAHSSPPKKLLVLSVSAGAGHLRAAQAICAAAAVHGGNLTAKHLDLMDYVSAGYRKLHTDFYIGLVNKHPAIWSHLYQFTHDAQPNSTMQRLRRAIERINSRALHKEIERYAPDAILCTHFLPAEILSNTISKGRLHCPVWVQVTDFGVHRMWLQQHMAGYFAANEETACRMQAYGIERELIHVTGIPVMPSFARQVSRAACAAMFGLDPNRTTMLLMGGGAGLGNLDTVAAAMLSFPGDFQLIALAGLNMSALSRLKTLAKRHPGRLLAMGYTERVECLMACSDLVITKPGGLTTAECLAMGMPMILNTPLPGQEERNADYLLEQGVALKAVDDLTLEYRVGHLLAHPEKLAEMRRNARALGKPDAARQVLDIISAALAQLHHPSAGRSHGRHLVALP